MSITEITDPSAVPAAVSDYEAQNTHLDRLLVNSAQPYPVSGSNVVKGVLFNIGGDMFYCDADTAITGTPSDYVKLVVTGSDAAPSYVSSLSGVTWNDANNGYYNVGGDLHVFDEAKAVAIGDLANGNGRLGVFAENAYIKKLNTSQGYQVHGNIRGTETHDVIFDTLSPAIPNVGDNMLITGCNVEQYNNGFSIIDRAERTSSTVITLYIMNSFNASLGTLTFTDGDTGNSKSLMISW